MEFNVISFNCIDTTGIADPVLAGKDATIATLQAEDEQGRIFTVALETAGEVDIEYKGAHYRDVSEFPEDLIDRIRESRGAVLFDGSDDDLMCWSNNWFEVAIFDADGNYIVDDPEIVEDDIELMGLEDIRDTILGSLERFLENY